MNVSWGHAVRHAFLNSARVRQGQREVPRVRAAVGGAQVGRRAARFGARVGARARVSARVQRTLSGAAARSSPLPGLLSPSPSQSGFQTSFASEMRDQTACSRQAGLSRARAVSRSPGFLRNRVLAPCLVSASSRRVARLFDEIACSRRPPVVLFSRARAVFVRLDFRVLAFSCSCVCSRARLPYRVFSRVWCASSRPHACGSSSGSRCRIVGW